MVGVTVRWDNTHLYELVGEAVYGRGKAGRGKVGRTNDDREKDSYAQVENRRGKRICY